MAELPELAALAPELAVMEEPQLRHRRGCPGCSALPGQKRFQGSNPVKLLLLLLLWAPKCCWQAQCSTHLKQLACQTPALAERGALTQETQAIC